MTGKSSVIQELVARGYRAHDLDTPEWSEWSEWIDADPSDVLTPSEGKDWVWREDRVRALLSQPGDGTLFIGGCAENMGRLFQLIDAVILLCSGRHYHGSAPDTIPREVRQHRRGAAEGWRSHRNDRAAAEEIRRPRDRYEQAGPGHGR